MLKKIFITLAIVVGIVLVGGGGFIWYLYHSVQSTANKIYDPAGGSGKNSSAIKNLQAFPILLLGVDERKGDVGRSDTMIALTLNPTKKSMQMISVPRDTKAEIVGHGTVNKINSAYAYGGPKMALNTFNNLFNVNFKHYLRINMEGLADLVDAVGGVTVHNDIDWRDEGYYKKGYHYQKGDITLDSGAKALGYVRMRHLDPRGDFGRNQRQRDVIMAVINKAASFGSFSKYQDILNAVQKNVKTNLTFDDMKNLASNYRDSKQNVQNYEVKGSDDWEKTSSGSKIYYLQISDDEKERVHQMIQDQLTDE
ncbi:transcriptional regulator LytR [Terrilactibacillus sp. BCM23-1]|uniref:Transcriptional regulator LytR n=1 Tax=Terrilactibacillus tamarindi TaxID=2599694 RepID=A0A6N8CRP0_9BACI|nr:LCP family protein [Terrilactibacillus tamarindi]MTT32852.1 transcriptional regulator LytR [Terrilactibacillus tamarindi]